MAIDLSVLNPEQRAAVEHGAGPLLILAGAGSGKTRAITYRIAHLVQDLHVAPWKIMAVTFTNKAAGEMRERLVKLLGPMDASQAQVATFHATGAAILRREAEALGRTRQFVIYDDGDQLALIKRLMRGARLDERSVPPRAIATHIDAAKNEAIGPDQLVAPDGPIVRPGDEAKVAAKLIYPLYERALEQANAFDFGDLIVKPLELFRTRKEILERYQRRFEWVLVDEFQDTNPAQFELLKRLCPPGGNLCVVGDDDQAIYRWRGADVSNILDFDRHYPSSKVVKLERNYRSDANILDAAYAVISRNARRKAKRLVTDAEAGAPLNLLASRDERGEAAMVSSGVKQLLASGVAPPQIAVFYRTNAQSRVLEEALRVGRVPYTIVRGRSFYDRAEVKDAVAYLRVAINPKSDADLLRVINNPPRGIGDTTVEHLTGYAQNKKLSVYEALGGVDFISDLKPAARRRLQEFRGVIDSLKEHTVSQHAAEAMEAVLEKSGLVTALEAEETPEADARIENLKELVSAAREFDMSRIAIAAQAKIDAEGSGSERDLDSGPLELPKEPLDAFLEQISLVGDADLSEDGKPSSGKVSMMTLHAAKGLEFDCVFLTGMEESIFPHSRALGEDADPEELAEERRLCYVGITRARKRLFFTLAQSRVVFGEVRFNRPSRFLSEIPKNLFGFTSPLPSLAPERSPEPAPRGERVVYDEEFSRGPQVRRHSGPRASSLGERVVHAKFGEGEVLSRDGDSDDAKVTVRFQTGVMKVIARFLRPL
ncbi:MAG: UvrD-helicase domain-containing protein [Deltaproteobacteria bacterium]|nr:UvrD-helicase domain-containing protein [Deltaproteobacteria bacterium]